MQSFTAQQGVQEGKKKISIQLIFIFLKPILLTIAFNNKSRGVMENIRQLTITQTTNWFTTSLGKGCNAKGWHKNGWQCLWGRGMLRDRWNPKTNPGLRHWPWIQTAHDSSVLKSKLEVIQGWCKYSKALENTSGLNKMLWAQMKCFRT